MDRFRSRSSEDEQALRTDPSGAAATGGRDAASRPHHRSSARFRMVTRLLLLLALVLASLTLIQCRQVGDRLTGISVDVFKRKDSCVKDCGKEYKEELREEKQKNKDEQRDCDGDLTCLAIEEARHQAALQAIEAELVGCLNGCHNQGGGGSDR